MENLSNIHNTLKGKILGHMIIHGRITEKEAFENYHITCTAQRIHDLRKDGYCIVSDMTEFTNACGHKGQYAVYRLKGYEGPAA